MNCKTLRGRVVNDPNLAGFANKGFFMTSLLAFILFSVGGVFAIKETVSHFYSKPVISEVQALWNMEMEQEELINQAKARLGALIKIRSRY